MVFTGTNGRSRWDIEIEADGCFITGESKTFERFGTGRCTGEGLDGDTIDVVMETGEETTHGLLDVKNLIMCSLQIQDMMHSATCIVDRSTST